MINWQNGKLNNGLRLVAFAVALIFTFQSVVWADGHGNVFLNSHTSTKELPNELTESLKTAQEAFSTIKLPKELGQIKHTFRGTHEGLVIHIQDAHVNEEAQRRIAEIIDYFVKEKGARLISVEGSAGELAHQPLSFFPHQKARELVADYFLKDALLTGPEFLTLSKHPELTLYGIEEEPLYQENRKAFLDALDFNQVVIFVKVLCCLKKSI